MPRPGLRNVQSCLLLGYFDDEHLGPALYFQRFYVSMRTRLPGLREDIGENLCSTDRIGPQESWPTWVFPLRFRTIPPGRRLLNNRSRAGKKQHAFKNTTQGFWISITVIERTRSRNNNVLDLLRKSTVIHSGSQVVGTRYR